jgi:hypothetical protein
MQTTDSINYQNKEQRLAEFLRKLAVLVDTYDVNINYDEAKENFTIAIGDGEPMFNQAHINTESLKACAMLLEQKSGPGRVELSADSFFPPDHEFTLGMRVLDSNAALELVSAMNNQEVIHGCTIQRVDFSDTQASYKEKILKLKIFVKNFEDEHGPLSL